jgi:hypothetical protein
MKYYRLSLDSLLELIRQGRADVARKAADEIRARCQSLESTPYSFGGTRIVTEEDGTEFELSISVDWDKIAKALYTGRKVNAMYRKARKHGSAHWFCLGGGVRADVKLIKFGEQHNETK